DEITMILKTASHPPNKEIVAYATIGKQFYKIQINYPVIQDEPLMGRRSNEYQEYFLFVVIFHFDLYRLNLFSRIVSIIMFFLPSSNQY
ncbi:hypothetical protein ACJX0J_019958, partial [Zea mays]